MEALGSTRQVVVAVRIEAVAAVVVAALVQRLHQQMKVQVLVQPDRWCLSHPSLSLLSPLGGREDRAERSDESQETSHTVRGEFRFRDDVCCEANWGKAEDFRCDCDGGERVKVGMKLRPIA